MAAARGSVVRKARGRPRRRWSSRNQGGVACGVGLSVGCMVSKLYEYVFTGAAVGTADGVHSLEALNPLNAMKGFGEL